MLILSENFDGRQKYTSLSRRKDANSQLLHMVVHLHSKSIKKEGC